MTEGSSEQSSHNLGSGFPAAGTLHIQIGTETPLMQLDAVTRATLEVQLEWRQIAISPYPDIESGKPIVAQRCAEFSVLRSHPWGVVREGTFPIRSLITPAPWPNLLKNEVVILARQRGQNLTL